MLPSRPTIDVGLRYRIHRPVVIVVTSGRGLEPASNSQPYYVGHLGVQFLLPPRSYNSEDIPESKQPGP